MGSIRYLVVAAVLFVAVSGEDSSMKDCFNQDSISCIQMTIFRKAKEFFDQPEITVLDGITFVKSNERNARSMVIDASAIETAKSVDERENALENYVSERAVRFFEDRSLNMDVMAVGRAVSTVIPEDVKESVRSMVGEARKKKKKIMKKLGPILGLLKLKLSGLLLIGLIGVGLIAKKALVIATIALVLSKLLLIKKLISKIGGAGGGGGGGGITEIIGGLGGIGGGGGGGDAHSVAYGGYAPQSHY